MHNNYWINLYCLIIQCKFCKTNPISYITMTPYAFSSICISSPKHTLFVDGIGLMLLPRIFFHPPSSEKILLIFIVPIQILLLCEGILFYSFIQFSELWSLDIALLYCLLYCRVNQFYKCVFFTLCLTSFKAKRWFSSFLYL